MKEETSNQLTCVILANDNLLTHTCRAWRTAGGLWIVDYSFVYYTHFFLGV